MEPRMCLNLPQQRERVEAASPWYQHIYGGRARDIYVTREGFARFWGHSLEYVDSLECNMKCFDDMQVGCEFLGYKIQDYRDGKINYRITFINYHFDPMVDHAPPHGIERPKTSSSRFTGYAV